MLDAEADRLCGAGRHERSDGRQDNRVGHDEGNLETKVGKVSPKAPKLRRQTFEVASIERYRRRRSLVEEALIEGISPACWCAAASTTSLSRSGVTIESAKGPSDNGDRVSPSTVSNLKKKIYAKIEEWRNRPIEGAHPYVFLDGIVTKRRAIEAPSVRARRRASRRGAQRLTAGVDRR